MAASSPDGFALIKPGRTYLGKQGIVYGAGASKETVGAQNICMNVMPPRAVAQVHNQLIFNVPDDGSKKRRM